MARANWSLVSFCIVSTMVAAPALAQEGAANGQHEHMQMSSFFTEGTWRAGMSSVYGRFEAQQPEIATLLTGGVVDTPEARSLRSTVLALTVGGVRDFVHARGFELGLGGDLTVYGVPDGLQTGRGFCGTTSCALGAGYGSSPVSFHIFFRLRPPAPMGRMWNMRMSQPIVGHQMGTMDHKMNQ